MPNRNALALIFSGCIALGFFIAGVFGVLDYFIVKALLFLALGALALYLLIVVSKSSETT